MAKIELDGRIGHKRDTDAALTQSGFVPLDGELVLAELDGEVRLKAGDGVRTYAELPFLDAVLREEIEGKADADHTHAEATESAGGFLSAADKEKLDGIEENANNYTHPTYFTRDSDLYKIRVNNLGHVSGAVAVTKDDITALGIPGVDTTYDPATTSSDGLMSAADKVKLNGISENANAVSFTRTATSGSRIGTLNIDGTQTILYAPTPTNISPSQITNLMQWKVNPLNSSSSGSVNVARNTNGYFGTYNVTQSGLYYLWYQAWLNPGEYEKTIAVFLDSMQKGEMSLRACASANTVVLCNSGIFSLTSGDMIRARIFHNCSNSQSVGYKYGVMLLRT